MLMTLCLGAGSASAQVAGHVKTCLPGNDRGNALSLAVDRGNILRIARVFRVTGDLYHTVIAPDGTVVDELVARRVSVLAGGEVDFTDLLVRGEQTWICYRNVVGATLEVAHREPEGWTREVVARGGDLADGCALLWDRDALVVAWGQGGGLHFAHREGPGDWATFHTDRAVSADVGHEVDAIRLTNGDLAAVHRDLTSGQLRVTWRQGRDRWSGETLDLEHPSAPGARIVDDGAGGVWIAHGLLPVEPNDTGLRVTRGVPGDLTTDLLVPVEIGGALGAARIDGHLAVVARERRRSVLFGAFDALHYYPALELRAQSEVVERYDAAAQRHVYRNIRAETDAFGLPVFAALLEASPHGADPGSGRTCYWRARDRDADRIPDSIEAMLGTQPDQADTDGDGRTDGEEYLLDRTDPLGEGDLPPLPDAALPDVGGEADGGVEDGGPDADAAIGDGGPLPDGAPSADAGPPTDGGLPTDGAHPDATARDATLADGARPAADADRPRDATRPRDAARSPRDAEADLHFVEADGGPDPPAAGGGDGCLAAPGRAPGSPAFLLALLLLVRRRGSPDGR